MDELKKELSGDLENVVVGLMETPTKFDVLQLYNAMKVCLPTICSEKGFPLCHLNSYSQ